MSAVLKATFIPDRIDVTHNAKYCVAWRAHEGFRIGYSAWYEDFKGDTVAAEAVARSKVIAHIPLA